MRDVNQLIEFQILELYNSQAMIGQNFISQGSFGELAVIGPQVFNSNGVMMPRSRANRLIRQTNPLDSISRVPAIGPNMTQLQTHLTDYLLKTTAEELFEISVYRYEECEREMRKRFDIKGIQMYQHYQYEANNASASFDSNGVAIRSGTADPNRTLTNWINKCGGSNNLTLKSSVSIAIIEMSKIRSIIENFEAWKGKVLASMTEENSYLTTADASLAQDLENQGYKQQQSGKAQLIPKNKRTQQLLIVQPSVSHELQPQTLKQQTLDQAFSARIQIGSSKSAFTKTRPESTSSNTLDYLQKALKSESEDFIKGVELLIHLTATLEERPTTLLLADLEILNKNFSRYYLYIPEFHRRKRLPVEPQLLPFTLAFTSRSRADQLERQSHFQFYHTFEIIFITKPASSPSSGARLPSPASHLLPQQEETQFLQQVAVPQYPQYRKGVPLGQPVLLTQDEYRCIMQDREEHERKYKRHLERLNAKRKKDEPQEIQIPIPSNPDRCFVCQASIHEDYLDHVRGDVHRKNVEDNAMYSEIDELIAELNFEQDFNLQKNKAAKVHLEDKKNHKRRIIAQKRAAQKFVPPTIHEVENEDDEEAKVAIQQAQDLQQQQPQRIQTFNINDTSTNNITMQSTEATYGKANAPKVAKGRALPQFSVFNVPKLDRLDSLQMVELQPPQFRGDQIPFLHLQAAGSHTIKVSKRPRAAIQEEDQQDNAKICAHASMQISNIPLKSCTKKRNIKPNPTASERFMENLLSKKRHEVGPLAEQ